MGRYLFFYIFDMFKHLHMELYLGLDIGGTHVAGALVDGSSGGLVAGSYYRDRLDAGGSREDILAKWRGALETVSQHASGKKITGIGIAMPGPFDYEKGISRIRGLNKYDALYGVDVRAWLTGTMGLPEDFPVVFNNDAACFGRGEYWTGAGHGAERMVAITLGTGLGATFLVHGVPVCSGPDVPEGGLLYHIPYQDQTAEDYFSSRGILKAYHHLTAVSLTEAKQLGLRAEAGEPEALAVLARFGTALGEFMAPWLKAFGAEVLVVGGGISRSSGFFLPQMEAALGAQGVDTTLGISRLADQAAIIGAAGYAKEYVKQDEPISNPILRSSGQQVLPLHLERRPEDGYDLYPAFQLPAGDIHVGWESLCDYIAKHPTVVIDGYQGVGWDDVAARLEKDLSGRGLKVAMQKTSDWFLPEPRLHALLQGYLGEADSVWGTRCDLELKDLFSSEKIAACRPEAAAVNIVLGCGAALAGWDGPVIYLEIPKNEIQFRMRAGSVGNLGCRERETDMQMYKRSFFVDWVLLNRHRKSILDRIELLVDCQRPESPTWIRIENFKQALRIMSENVFRARPWFEPGAWGGQWLKRHIRGMAQDEVNYAWSFELITPENGILLESGGLSLEASFDYLMAYHAAAILGPDFEKRFGDVFPIRFDFLDTIEGGNLSIQCHPSVSYIKAHFGEDFTQDETYYILEAEPDASVYLGFRDDIDPVKFREALERSDREGETLEIEDYVQRFSAKKHDLFLIPNCTVHSAAAGNLVLEISATPYIFTFKMYDWLRLDLNGDPRPINIGHAFHNLDFSRKGERVRRELISHPREIAKGDGWRLIHLPTHPDHFYDVHRYEFTGEVRVETGGSCHVLMVVEGASVTVETARGFTEKYSFAETFVVPAAAGSYRLISEQGSGVKVVKAFLKAARTRPEPVLG